MAMTGPLWGNVAVFTVPGDPVTWKRARRGKSGSYTDPKDAAHREKIRAFARNAGIRRKLTGPVRLAVTYYRETRDLTALSFGDLDNLTKSVKDALRGIAYEDDRQVIAMVTLKGTGEPRTEITIGPASEAEWVGGGPDAAVEEAETRTSPTAGKDPEQPA